MTDIDRMLTDIRFYEQIAGDAKRTILCPPPLADAVRQVVEARGAGHVYTVKASAACPDDKLIVLDEQAMEAGFRQTAQTAWRGLYR